MTRSSTPRRIPTEEIEVGRAYLTSEVRPSDAHLYVIAYDERGARALVRAYTLWETAVYESAWIYPGPIPDSLPPREEKPKRFTVGCYEGKISVFQWGRPYLVDPFSLSLGFTMQEVADLLNAGHEALEGGA